MVDEDAVRAGEIHMIAVDPAYHGTGVGASLMQRALTHIKAQGVDLAVVATGADPGNAPARALSGKFDSDPPCGTTRRFDPAGRRLDRADEHTVPIAERQWHIRGALQGHRCQAQGGCDI